MKNVKLLPFLAGFGIILTSCQGSSNFEDLDKFMREADARPGGKLEDPPAAVVYESFVYSQNSLRSPFDEPSTIEDIIQNIENSDVQPDRDRPKEALERFRIEALTMVGTLQKPGESVITALVKDPEANIHQVKIGNFMGKNDGRIVSISAKRIDMVEIVTNGRGGWLERPRTIELAETK